MESEGRKIHGLAAQARERGDFLESLKLGDEALLAYQKDGDVLGMAEVLADRSIVFRHLAEQEQDNSFLMIAEAENKSAIRIVENYGDKTALAFPWFNLGKVQEQIGDYPEAVKSFQQAVENIVNNPPAEHNVPDRPAIIADFKVHLAICEYRAGDESAKDKAENALLELEQASEISDYNKNVWVSGGHMHLAEALKDEDPEKAKEHLEKARKVIDSDERLTIRKKQWEKLTESFK